MSQSKLQLSLSDPMRMINIKLHRENLHRCRTHPPVSVPPPFSSSSTPSEPYEMFNREKLQARVSNRCKETTLSMMKSYNLTYAAVAKFIELTIIDETFVEKELAIGDYPAPKNFLVEDKNKQVLTLQVKGLPDNENTSEMFAAGMVVFVLDCRLTEMCNVSKGESDHARIRVDESEGKRIYHVGRKINICRYCGEENAEKKCSNCKVPYCSRECQVADWSKLKHKLVCEAKPVEEEGVNKEPVMTKGEERIARIINFRKSYNVIVKRFRSSSTLIIREPKLGFLLPEMKNPLNPEPIFLKDMKPDNIYKGKVIDLKIIEESLFGSSEFAIHSVVEDKNKDVCNLTINGLAHPKNRSLCVRFQVGTTFSVVNPYYKTGAADGVPMIRVDHLKSILGLKENMNVCRFCGKGDPRMECGVCKRKYCGKECQDEDLKILQHNLVCETGAESLIARGDKVLM